MPEQITFHTAGLIAIQNKKLLLAYSNNKNAWYLPGGKVDTGETTLQSLQREIAEELNLQLDPKKIKFYCHITAPAFGENPNIIMEQDCFLYDLTEDITPSNEIGTIQFFDLETYQLEPHQVIGTLEVFERLIQDNLL